MKKGDQGVILIAEDDEEDFRLVERAFQESRLSKKIIRVHNGQELIDYLLGNGSAADSPTAPRPDLILLDLDMPVKDGREALREIKTNDCLKKIPIVILTASRSEEDIVRSYEQGASSVIRKPLRYSELVRVIRGLIAYWFGIVILPDRSKEGEA
ncbi:MAG: response regulator [Pseudomonadota bacterium]